MAKFRIYGVSTKEETQREIKHRELARKVAASGIVLLKNSGILPLSNKKVALYGPGSRMTVKGGRGSGDVRERYSITIEQGLLNAGFVFPTVTWMDRFELKYKADIKTWRERIEEQIKGYSPIKTMQMFNKIGENPMPYPFCTPILQDELTDETDIAIYVISRQAGEGDDRKYEKGDYLLSDVEIDSLKTLSEHYKKLILIINSGSVLDLSVIDEVRIDAVLYYAQGGMEGGNALADILSGKITPSGKLTDTWGMKYSDYPSSDTFSHINGNTDYENYYEGIYVGYKYFSTFDIKSRFPFGYGLSYTTFSNKMTDFTVEGTKVTIATTVSNTGTKYNGSEVIQLYLQKPSIVYDHEKYSLVAFAKSRVLKVKEQDQLLLSFDLRDFATFDEKQNCFLLPAGEYGLYLGTSTDDVKSCAVLVVTDETIIEKVNSVCSKIQDFDDIKSKKNERIYDALLPRKIIELPKIEKINHYDDEKFIASTKVAKFINNLSDKDKIRLVTGGGYKIKCYNNVMGAAGRTSTKLLKKGIPNIVFADGPAGLNVAQSTVIMKDGTPRYPDGLPDDWKWGWLKKIEFLVKAKPGKGRPVYRFMTAWPNATLQAQTWDIELIEEVGNAIGTEMLEIGVSIWLAPGMNIHRNPLCGRNFEYYSEDPLLSGKIAAAVTRGVQSKGGVGVTIKHYCCNNQEENRNKVSENVSQRALRELYLRNFRIAIAEEQPWSIMTSYNRINDIYAVNSYELCTEVLRKEWGFKGLVMSDWNATDPCSNVGAINSGNDMIMPGHKHIRKELLKALKDGTLEKKALDKSTTRVLNMIFNSAASEGF